MKRKSNAYFLLFLIGFGFGDTVSAQKSTVSEERLKQVREIILQYQRAGEDLQDEDVVASIHRDISKIGPLVPKETPKTQPTESLAAELKTMVDKKFPKSPEQIREEAIRKAEEKYKMVEPLSYVTVYYERGDKIFKVDGIFYSYGGNSIKIDEKNVAIYDLLPEYRAKFDKNYSETKKREYINQEMMDYFQKKSEFQTEIYREIRKEQQKFNEDVGYVYAWREWRTLKDVCNIFIQNTSEGRRLTPKTDVDKTLAALKERDASGAKTEPPEGGPDLMQSPDSAEKSKADGAERLRKTVEEKLAQIGQMYAGIDADQGYGLAIWGMPRKDVRTLYGDRIVAAEKETQSDQDVLVFDSGPIEKVVFHFFNDFFFKVDIRFRTVSGEAMHRLAMHMKERYGRTDEEKQSIEEQRAKVADAEKAEEKQAEGAEGAEVPPEEVKLLQHFHWTGDITKGRLTVRISDDKSGYEEFVFTKESPKVIDEVQLQLDRERLKQQEIDRQKKLKEFEKKPIEKIDF
jgi:hypothetical protein